MLPIPHTDGYYADKSGNIYSIRPFKRSKKFRKDPILIKPQKSPNGYSIVKVIFNGKRKMMSRAYLVLLTYVSDRPSKNHQICHGIKGKFNSSLDNISWGTTSKNNKEDKIRDGTLMIGEKHHNSKLTNVDVLEIRKLNKKGFNNHEIAKIFYVHHSNISCILKGKTWSHVI